MERNYHFETLQIHAGQEEPDSATGARAVPIYASTSYVFRDCQHAADRFALKDAGNIYSRLTNPTQGAFEQRMAALEGGAAALATASGAAAVAYAVQALARAGDHIVSVSTVYGGTYNYFEHGLPDFGVSVTFVNPDQEGAFERALRDNTKLIFVETIGNPNANLIDLEQVAALAHAHGIPLVVDSTFATPYLLRPIEYGADVVVHSATKFIGGHGTVLGGVVIDSGKFDWKASGKFPQLTEPNASYHGISFTEAAGPAALATYIRALLLRDTGATVSPFNAFLFLQGLESLSLRVQRHAENAVKVAEYLSQHPKVARVNHPSLPDSPYRKLYEKYFPKGGASIFTVEIKGGAEEAKRFIDSLQIFSLLANVADAKSLVIHPASTTHGQMTEQEQADSGILPNSVRLSVGTEHIDDLLWDLEQALEKV